jgi:hypothetical protein
MKKLLFSAITALAITAYPIRADHKQERTATLTSNIANGESGQCSVEVVVPSRAFIRVEAGAATLEELSGRAPEWKRFECTSPMPEKPVAFRMETTGGRGTQELVYGPRHNGGKAKIYIHDGKSGDDTYSFNLIWGMP